MQPTPSGKRIPVLASIVALIIVVVGFGYYYTSSTGTISSLNSSISSQQGVISSLRGNVTANQQLVTLLRQIISADTSSISTLNASNIVDKATITSLNSQISTAQRLISNLTSIVRLQNSTVLVNGIAVTIYGNSTTPTPFLNFTAKYAGYLIVTVTTPSEANWMDHTEKPAYNNPTGAVFESVTGRSLTSPVPTHYIIDVIPGTNNAYSLVDEVSKKSGTATVTATYYY